jgi:hypothetical protein
MATSAPYNFNPGTQAGSGAYGSVPGTIGVPPSEYEQLGNLLPGLPGLTGSAAGVVGSELAGTLSPGTQNLLQDKAAEFGVNSGMPWTTPGNTLPFQNFMNSTGLTSEGLSQQGVGSYLNFATGLGGLQTNPNLAFEVASQNAVDASAPNPADAAQMQLSEFEQYMNQMNNPAGGSGGIGGYQWGKGYQPPGEGEWHQQSGTGPYLPGPV